MGLYYLEGMCSLCSTVEVKISLLGDRSANGISLTSFEHCLIID